MRYIQDIAKLKKDDLSIEEVNILFGSIHTLIKNTKKQWEIICSIESKEIKKKSKYVQKRTSLNIKRTSELALEEIIYLLQIPTQKRTKYEGSGVQDTKRV